MVVAGLTTPQLSVAITAEGSGSGISTMHCAVPSAGQLVITGGVSSITVNVCVQVVALPHTSVISYVYILMKGSAWQPLPLSVVSTTVAVLSIVISSYYRGWIRIWYICYALNCPIWGTSSYDR